MKTKCILSLVTVVAFLFTGTAFSAMAPASGTTTSLDAPDSDPELLRKDGKGGKRGKDGKGGKRGKRDGKGGKGEGEGEGDRRKGSGDRHDGDDQGEKVPS